MRSPEGHGQHLRKEHSTGAFHRCVLLHRLQGVLVNLRAASRNLQLASTNLPSISDAFAQEARDLRGLVLQSQKSMRELEVFIGALQRHWLFRRYMNQAAPAENSQRKRR